MTPAVFGNVPHGARIAREEVFGPLVSVFPFETEDEALRIANNSKYGLAAYAATSNAGRVRRLARDLEAGSLTIFSALGVESAGHFFGVEPHKQSGLNIEGGVAGLLPYTAVSHVMELFAG